MKFNFFITTILFLSLCLGLNAQVEVCGFDALNRQLKKDPNYVKQLELTEAKIQAEIGKIEQQQQFLQNMDIQPGPIYEIPVVVHIVYKSTDAAIGSPSNPSDATIQAAIDALNNNFAAAAGSSNDWASTPIRFALAKRTMNCMPTTGIMRYNGGSLADYDANGLEPPNSPANTPGVTLSEVKALTGVWNIYNYYNIWVVSTIGGGISGFASLPISTTGQYVIPSGDGAFMRASSMVASSVTLTHEMGHAFGLHHTFEGGDQQNCPPAGSCNSTGDLVCDTDPVKNLLIAFPFPQDAEINPCTNTAYNGSQRNIMGYGLVRNRYTPDQSTRMQATLQAVRGGLATSDATLPPPASLVMPTQQIPPNIANPNNQFGMGPEKVTLANMMYASNSLSSTLNDYYVDNTCNIGTHVSSALPQISVTTSTNQQRCKVWIDFNDNGQFDATELVMNSMAPIAEFTHTAVIPNAATLVAVKNTPVRMRVMADFLTGFDFGPADQLDYGQTEDFWVSFDQTLPVVFGEIAAEKRADGLFVSWKTNTESNNSYFLVEGSVDGKVFNQLAKVSSKAENGTTPIAQQYSVLISNTGTVVVLGGSLLALAFSAFSFCHRRNVTAAVIGVLSLVAIAESCSKQNTLGEANQDGVNYIRIAQVDKDGITQYSKVIKVRK